ncbi:MAG: glycogen synthase [Candidatus Kapabacteria bacterium]|nr:glycogen synthase [Candidatus Kapabacteria bacterium]
MNILVVAAEVAPFAKVGGLADMTGALPRAWWADGHEVAIMLPLYGSIDRELYGIVRTEHVVSVPVGYWTEYAEVWHGKLPGTEVPIYFLRSAEYFDRKGIYGYHEGFEDNDRRYLFFSRAALETAKVLGFQPDVVHAHDYHAAPCMPMLATQYRHDPFFARTAGVFTIHNMAFQGMYDPVRAMEFGGFPPSEFYPSSWFEHHGSFNAMKAGIMFADKVTTVSPTYSQEIRWTSEGMGLQGALQHRASDLLGVLNGIDDTIWNPRVDEHIAVPYDATTLQKKRINKLALLRELNLPCEGASADLPVIGMVTRMTQQKGIPIMTRPVWEVLQQGRARLVILGSGVREYEDYFRRAQDQFPDLVRFVTGYNEPLSHRIQAGSDLYLMPSQFEPCGLTQMYAMAYGTVPIVRAVGGLADTVVHYERTSGTGSGVRFHDYDESAVAAALDYGLGLYNDEPHWSTLRTNAMQQDNSISVAARRYVEVFSWAQERLP